MNKINTYIRPESAKAAAAALADCKGKAVLLAGGIQIVKTMPPGVTAVVDLRDARLSYIKKEAACLKIGAGTTFSEMVASPVIKKWAGGMMHKAALRVSSNMIRNMATVGGSIVRPYPFNHFPAVLYALDAKAVIVLKGKTSKVAIAEIFEKELGSELGRTAVLSEIQIPAGTEKWNGVFDRVAKTESSWENIMICAAAAEIKGGVCKNIRLALGSALPKPVRLLKAEKSLSGKKITDILASQAGDIGAGEAGSFNSVSAPSEYKRQIAPAVIKRCVLAVS
ncbi:MAG: FAD binding domain-containing protein [Elusimicrobiaceae bacterium]